MSADSAVRTESLNDEFELDVPLGSFGDAGRGLLVFVIPWTLTVVVTVGGAIVQGPTVQNVCFAIPFVASWIFLAGSLLYMKFGFERLRLGPGGLWYEWGVLLRFGGRHVPLEEVKGVSLYTWQPGWKERGVRSNAPEQGVKVETLGRPLRLAKPLTEEERTWIVRLLQERLRALQQPSTLGEPSAGQSGSRVERLRATQERPLLPSDSAVRLEWDWESISFVQTYPLSLLTLAVLTFGVLLWNGAVTTLLAAMLLAPPPSNDKSVAVAGFLFMIPFEVIGALLAAAWLTYLSRPAWRKQWTFRDGEAQVVFSVFGLGIRRRRINIDGPAQLELRRAVAVPARGAGPSPLGATPPGTCPDPAKTGRADRTDENLPFGARLYAEMRKVSGYDILTVMLDYEAIQQLKRADREQTLKLFSRSHPRILQQIRTKPPEEIARYLLLEARYGSILPTKHARRLCQPVASPRSGNGTQEVATFALLGRQDEELLVLEGVPADKGRRVAERFDHVECRGRAEGQPMTAKAAGTALVLADRARHELLTLHDLPPEAAEDIAWGMHGAEVRLPAPIVPLEDRPLVQRNTEAPLRFCPAYTPGGDEPFTLALVDSAGRDLLAIDRLTEGEARWIADQLFGNFPEWFVHDKKQA
jgi:hypothetical protein